MTADAEKLDVATAGDEVGAEHIGATGRNANDWKSCRGTS